MVPHWRVGDKSRRVPFCTARGFCPGVPSGDAGVALYDFIDENRDELIGKSAMAHGHVGQGCYTRNS
jgi:hypothetical protein